MQNNLKCIDLPVDDNNYLVIVKMQSSSHSSLESLKNIHISPFRPGKLVREISSSAKLGSSSFPHPVKVKNEYCINKNSNCMGSLGCAET